MNNPGVRRTRNFYLFLFCFLFLAMGCGEKKSSATLESPISPKDALATFEVEPGFKIELVASEPLIADPVAMEIDEDGNLYVVENHGYPLDKTKSSKIKFLRDTNGDGQMDTSTIFADTLVMPTGVLRWKKGILVTDAPNVLYMEDTNNDGKADIIQVILTGFALSNPQHNLNTPILGLDNWIYLAHQRSVETEVYKKELGDQGGEIYFPGVPGGKRLPQNANGRNVRFRPAQHEMEMLASSTQFGQCFDVWGNHFLVDNSNHLMQSVIAAEYLNRNPKLMVSTSIASLPDHGNAAEVFPITKNPNPQLLTDKGVMTSACSITAYSGGAFPEEYNNNTTFVAEPVSNIVHVDKLKPNGSTFVASRMEQKKEFLASTDMWCRPVNFYVGPDGALYVVDYYREIIEHPEWLADDVINSGKLYNGHDMGRIYRISKTDAKPATWTTDLKLSQATDEELVNKLADPNIWWRRTAQRLLIDRNNPQATSSLVKMARNDHAPLGRLHALWTLEGLGQLQPQEIEGALTDAEAGVRTNAIQLAELHLKTTPGLEKNLIALQNDGDAKVRFQLLCTLGFIDTPQAAEVRNKLLFQDVQDEFVQVAALSARSSQTDHLLDLTLARYQPDTPAYGRLIQNLSAMAGSGEKNPYAFKLLQKSTAPFSNAEATWQIPVLKGLARAFRNRKAPISLAEENLLFKAFFDNPDVSVRQASLQVLQSNKLAQGPQIKSAIQKARQISGDEKVPERERALAISFLGLQNPVSDAKFLQEEIVSNKSLPVQLAALKTLDKIPDHTVADFALQHWSTLDPALQDAALNTFMEDPDRIKMLIDAIESGKVQASSVGWWRSVQLMTQPDIAVRDRARALLVTDQERKKVIEEYQPALKLKGDVAKGKLVYGKTCAICHVKGETGIPFGPDLGTIQSWPPSGIMANIIDPNQSISHGFDLWSVEVKNGEPVEGVITAETPSTLTLRNANGQVNTVAREDIESQDAMHMSAMPVGLEKNISQQDMADLLAFLKQ